MTVDTDADTLKRYAAAHDVALDPAWDKDKIFLELLSELVEPTLLQPTFLCDYPAIAQPLARPHRSLPGLIEAWDLIVGGVERATGFSELVDPVIQRDVLTAQSLRARARLGSGHRALPQCQPAGDHSLSPSEAGSVKSWTRSGRM